MKKIFALAFALVSLSCSTEGPTGTPESEEFFFQENKIITVSTSDDLLFAFTADGDKIVFTYFFDAAQEDDIADDEFSEFIIFEIDPVLESFNYTATDFDIISPYYRVSCFCSSDSTLITSGSISGTKINDTLWEVTIDVEFERNEITQSRTISNSFIRRE